MLILLTFELKKGIANREFNDQLRGCVCGGSLVGETFRETKRDKSGWNLFKRDQQPATTHRKLINP